jgi:hydroxypyruvate reductase
MVTFRARERHARSPAHETALACLEAGVAAALPGRAVDRELSLDGDVFRVGETTYDLTAFDDVLVLGAGKATGRLARALEALLGDRIAGGCVALDAPADPPLDRIGTAVGEHPVPGEGSVAGAHRVLELAREADERMLVLAAFTGGGSALLAGPADGLALADVQGVTERLLDAGAAIAEVNAVRKHCSAVKGGRLAAACAPATVVSLLVSDVVGDDPSVIASGPTVPDPTTYADALNVLDRYGVDATAVQAHLRAGHDDEREETPTADAPAFERGSVHVLASGRTALDTAREVARKRGYTPCLLAAGVEGEAREAGRFHGAVAREKLDSGSPVEPPAVLLSGGECTVTVDEDGTGGPNGEFALGAALNLPDGVVVGAVDTDGRDGSTDTAGALVDGGTVIDHRAAREALDANDSHGYLEEAGALLSSGRTGTNVNDLRVVVVPESPDGGPDDRGGDV